MRNRNWHVMVDLSTIAQAVTEAMLWAGRGDPESEGDSEMMLQSKVRLLLQVVDTLKDSLERRGPGLGVKGEGTR